MIGLLSKISLFAVCCSIAGAVPASESTIRVVKRAPGDDQANPIDATFDITGWESVAEMNCYIMLCCGHDDPGRVFQRAKGAGPANRRGAGTQLRGGGPFLDQEEMSKRHTTRISDQCTWGEDFPWASTAQGGKDPGRNGATRSFTMGATQDEEIRQGNAIQAGYVDHGIQDEKWFRISFKGKLGPWCEAMMKDDTSKCRNDQNPQLLFGVTAILANFIYQYVRQGASPFGFVHAGGPDAGKFTKKRSDIFGEQYYPVAQIEPDQTRA